MEQVLINKNTCWHQDEVVNELNRFFDAHRYNPETSKHFEAYMKLLKIARAVFLLPPRLVDIGCGNGQLQDFVKDYVNYSGADFKHIIHGCLYRNYPGTPGFYFNLMEGDTSLISGFDIVSLNAVIDVMQYPLVALSRLFPFAKEYVIIHRQEITEHGETRSEINPAYNSVTYHSIINRAAFVNVITDNGFDIVHEEKLDCGFPWENGGSSFLLKKR